ncbi:biotin transporter BioY [Halobacillus shinanisalinarum]|uniref:Biotin transporter n=1 Tax=Halobacillus shinanisalinarum TaxID=2932258 RepID=A0ABY4H4E2_9BACI|nr:biotin transporter BioY [Halobacillus shinanisalinarum]UOQ95229.1 biotin transporter BioY [Halobacillus shinanisalinarum]
MQKSRSTAYDMTIGALFVALMAIGSNITAFAPFLSIMNVPLTLQTFVAILAGIILGSRLGFFSMFVYTVLGLIGAPVFAGFKGGVGTFFMPTFGFILSFMFLAFAVGKIVENRRTFSMYMSASVVGLLINFIVGVNWMYMALQLWIGEGSGIGYAIAWSSMTPFLVKDLALAVLAAVFAYRLEKGVLHRTPLRKTA